MYKAIEALSEPPGSLKLVIASNKMFSNLQASRGYHLSSIHYAHTIRIVSLSTQNCLTDKDRSKALT